MSPRKDDGKTVAKRKAERVATEKEDAKQEAERITAGREAGRIVNESVQTLKGHSTVVDSVSFSTDGKRIVSGGGNAGSGEIRLWDAETGQLTLMLKGHSAWVQSVSFSPDGKRIVSGSHDNTLKVWDISSLDTSK